MCYNTRMTVFILTMKRPRTSYVDFLQAFYITSVIVAGIISDLADLASLAERI